MPSRLLLALIAVAIIFGVLYLPVRFALTFELLGPAVNSPGDGWLGPTPRSAGQCVVDAGKVNVWKCSDKSVFVAHHFGCRLWLRFFDYEAT
jgi:hypothetical protein